MTIDWKIVPYPSLPRRIYAAAVDQSILAAGIVVLTLVIGPMQPAPWVLVAIAGVILSVEPVLIANTGASLGHRLFGLRVVDSRSGDSISFFRAVLRMFARILLGIPSLFLIHTTARYQAIHDLLARSVITVQDPALFPQHQLRHLREAVEDGYIYPSHLRRTSVIAGYSIGSLILAGLAMVAGLSEECLDGKKCSSVESAYEYAVSWIWIVSLGVLVVYGWRGSLWGARRRKRLV